MVRYARLMARRRLPEHLVIRLLEYKKSKLEAIETLEKNRLEDIKHGREIVFKYALPASTMESLFGALISWLTKNAIFILPTILLVLISFSLAYHLDLRKTIEREDVMQRTEQQLEDIRKQEEEAILTV